MLGRKPRIRVVTGRWGFSIPPGNLTQQERFNVQDARVWCRKQNLARGGL